MDQQIINMDDIITRSTIGTGGFFATLGLSNINEIVSIAVGLATFVYMVVSIIKALRKL